METEQNLIVQEILESTTSYLNEAKKHHLLQQEEIQHIVKTRTDYEYKLVASKRTKDIYLRYIQFEVNLLSLIFTRIRKMAVNIFMSRHIDQLKHVEGIFKRAIHLDQKDVHMWKTYVDFCVKFNHNVEAVLENAVRTNPMNPDMWILAAKWQVDVNQSAESARYLFQRAIKLNKLSENLWTEFFKLEAVLARVEIVEPTVDENENAVRKYSTESEQQELYELPMLIYSQITKTSQLKDNFNLRFKLLDILYNLEYTNHLQNHILRDIMASFRDNEDCMMRCLTLELERYLSDYQVKKSSIQREVYEFAVKTLDLVEKALVVISTEKMWLLYSRLCIRLFLLFSTYSGTQLENTQMQELPGKRGKYQRYFFARLMDTIYPNANKKGFMGAEMLHDYCSMLYRSSNSKLMCQTLTHACTKLYPHDAKLWILFMSAMKGDKKAVDSAIEHYITKPALPRESKEFASEAELQKLFWKTVLGYVKKWSNNLTVQQLDHYFIQAMKYCSHSTSVKKMFFKFYAEQYPYEGNTEPIRLKKKYEKLESVVQTALSLPPNTVELYRYLIAYFTTLASNKDLANVPVKQEQNTNVDSSDDEDDTMTFDTTKAIDRILFKLYSRAITDHGREEEDFWLHYIVMMKRQKNFQKAQNLHHQATKTLKDSAAVQRFLEKFDLVK